MCVEIKCVEYNVFCRSCDLVWQPGFKTPLWWRAKQYADSGKLDAISVSGEECGCIEKRIESDAPFRVFGYDGMCCDFDIPLPTFVSAVKRYIAHAKAGDILFITGVSPRVQERLHQVF